MLVSKQCHNLLQATFKSNFGQKLDRVAHLVSFASTNAGNNSAAASAPPAEDDSTSRETGTKPKIPQRRKIIPDEDTSSISSGSSGGSVRTVVNFNAEIHNSDLMGQTTIKY